MIDVVQPTRLCHIVYDLDDVIANFWGTALPILNKVYGSQLHKEEFTDYNNFVDRIGITKDQFLQFVVDRVPLIDLEVNEAFKCLINGQYTHGHFITIITSRDYISNAEEITRAWLKKNGILYHNLHISGKVKKSEFLEFGADIVYDDHHGNIDDYIDSGKLNGYGVIVDQPWNRHYKRENVIRKSVNSEGVILYG